MLLCLYIAGKGKSQNPFPNDNHFYRNSNIRLIGLHCSIYTNGVPSVQIRGNNRCIRDKKNTPQILFQALFCRYMTDKHYTDQNRVRGTSLALYCRNIRTQMFPHKCMIPLQRGELSLTV